MWAAGDRERLGNPNFDAVRRRGAAGYDVVGQWQTRPGMPGPLRSIIAAVQMPTVYDAGGEYCSASLICVSMPVRCCRCCADKTCNTTAVAWCAVRASLLLQICMPPGALTGLLIATAARAPCRRTT